MQRRSLGENPTPPTPPAASQPSPERKRKEAERKLIQQALRGLPALLGSAFVCGRGGRQEGLDHLEEYEGSGSSGGLKQPWTRVPEQRRLLVKMAGDESLLSSYCLLGIVKAPLLS